LAIDFWALPAFFAAFPEVLGAILKSKEFDKFSGGDDGSSKVKEEEVDTAWSARKEERKGKYSRRERRQSRMVGFWKGSR
jgi:hypothetical protein